MVHPHKKTSLFYKKVLLYRNNLIQIENHGHKDKEVAHGISLSNKSGADFASICCKIGTNY